MAALRRSSDRRGFALVGFVQPSDEPLAVPAERVLDAQGDVRALCEQRSMQLIEDAACAAGST